MRRVVECRRVVGFPQFVDAFKKVPAVNPNHVEALKSMGEVLLDRQSYSEALDYFGKALKASPASDEINGRIAETHLHMGRLTEAEAVLDGVLGDQSQASNVHHLLAQIAEQRGDASRAEREYRLEIATSPWDYRARFNLASLVGRRGEHREQVELLQSILKLAPQFADAHFYLAKALLDAGDSRRFDEAIAEAARGLALPPVSPSAPPAHYVRADIYRLQGRAAESQREVDLGRALEMRVSERGR